MLLHALEQIKRKSFTFFKNPVAGIKNNVIFFQNNLWPAVTLAVRKKFHAPKITALSEEDQEIVDGLSREGYWVTHLDNFNAEIGQDFMAQVDELFQSIDLQKSIVPGAYLAQVDTPMIEARKDLILFGLSERILNIVENYIQLPVFYRGVSVRRDYPDGQQIETRLWHKDFEDYKIVKIIIYVSDVDTDSGPYEVISKFANISNEDVCFAGGRVGDQDMMQAASLEHVKSITGRRGTMIFTDTASCFHRGKMPKLRHRDALFYAYNSNKPRSKWGAEPMYEPNEVFNMDEISARQRYATKCQ